MKRAAAIPIVFFAVLLFQSSCAHSVPPVPVVSVEGLDADVRNAIEAHAMKLSRGRRTARLPGTWGWCC